mmetsp:Transcript_31335/g.58415  ORF Transcript_31335/g.58415 Transcript_31335/m.58415 type:complete len:238 (+) Transcript_31335:622-1335(+)
MGATADPRTIRAEPKATLASILPSRSTLNTTPSSPATLSSPPTGTARRPLPTQATLLPRATAEVEGDCCPTREPSSHPPRATRTSKPEGRPTSNHPCTPVMARAMVAKATAAPVGGTHRPLHSRRTIPMGFPPQPPALGRCPSDPRSTHPAGGGQEPATIGDRLATISLRPGTYVSSIRCAGARRNAGLHVRRAHSLMLLTRTSYDALVRALNPINGGGARGGGCVVRAVWAGRAGV